MIRIELVGDAEGEYRIDLVHAGPCYVTLYANTVDELMLAVEHHYSSRHNLDPRARCPICRWAERRGGFL